MRNFNRIVKKIQQRKSLKLQQHLEALGAAWCEKTGIHPADAVLVTKESKFEDGRVGQDYWYETRNNQDLKETCLMLLSAISKAYVDKDEPHLESLLKELPDFLNRVMEITNEIDQLPDLDTTEAGSVTAD